MELLSWRTGLTSVREVASYLGQVDDNEVNEGVVDSQDQIDQTLDYVMHEVELRSDACRSGYPFKIDANGLALRYDPAVPNSQTSVYRYLLLSTRLNMDQHRLQANIDGTHLLEQLAESVLSNYLGDRALSFVFGTSARGSFPDRVNELCRALCEGGGYQSLSGRQRSSGDDKLDVVAWKGFSDTLPGKLILFAQCKTGTSWRNDVAQLQPDAFHDKWIRAPFGLNPVRAFVVSEAEERHRFPETVQDTGLFFDRCRIVDFCPDLDSKLEAKIASWTTAAFAVADQALGVSRQAGPNTDRA